MPGVIFQANMTHLFQGILPGGTKIRALAEEALQRSLALAPSMSWIHGLGMRKSWVEPHGPVFPPPLDLDHQIQSSREQTSLSSLHHHA